MSHPIGKVRAALVAWLRWHAATRQEIDSAPEDCKPLFEAMSQASGAQTIALLAREIETGMTPEEVSEARRVIDDNCKGW